MSSLPAKLNIGDSLPYSFTLPPAPEAGAWEAAFYLFTRHSSVESERADRSVSPVIQTGESKVEGFIDAPTITAWGAGIWKWYLRLQADTFFQTVESGVIIISDITDGTLTHERRTLDLLELILEDKLSNRKDITQYMIGDRNVVTMSIQELRIEIDNYKERLRFRNNKRRTWQSW